VLSEGVLTLTGTGALFECASGSGRSLKCYDVTGSRAVVCYEHFCLSTTPEPMLIVLFLGGRYEDWFMKIRLSRFVYEGLLGREVSIPRRARSYFIALNGFRS
jgi:hypothetical protein